MNNLISSQKQKSLISCKKAAGSIEKVQKMISADTYCVSVIQQIDAAIGLLESTKKTLLCGHLSHCLSDKLKDNKDKTISELIRIYKVAK